MSSPRSVAQVSIRPCASSPVSEFAHSSRRSQGRAGLHALHQATPGALSACDRQHRRSWVPAHCTQQTAPFRSRNVQGLVGGDQSPFITLGSQPPLALGGLAEPVPGLGPTSHSPDGAV
eukprot:927958-Lingulodinium_polyedra.AAC.1